MYSNEKNTMQQVIRTYFVQFPIQNFPYQIKPKEVDKVSRSEGDGLFVEVISDIDDVELSRAQFAFHDTRVEYNVNGINVIVEAQYDIEPQKNSFVIRTNHPGLDTNLGKFLTREPKSVAKVMRAVEKKICGFDKRFRPVFSYHMTSNKVYGELKRKLEEKLN